MRYLSVFLSGEYYISPFKYHFHTQRGPVSCSVFFFFFFSLPALFIVKQLCFRRDDGLFARFFFVFFYQRGFLIRECKSWIFTNMGLMKKAWTQTVVSWHGATDDGLKFKCCSYLLWPLWPYRWTSTEKLIISSSVSVFLFLSAPVPRVTVI